MNTIKKPTNQEILENLNHFNGTTKYIRHSPQLLPWFHLTDGTEYLAEKCQVYWLFDLIASYQSDPKVLNNKRLQAIQFWDLNVKDSKGVVTCSWDQGQIVLTQKIGYTDFPLESVCIFVSPLYLSPDDTSGKWVAYLQSEY